MVYNALAGYQKRISPRITFWSSNGDWPEDTRDHVFLARAVLKLCRQRHGSVWSDQIPAEEFVTELPPNLSLYTSMDHIWRAVHVLRQHSASYVQRSGGLGLMSPPDLEPDFPNRDEWAKAATIIKVSADDFWSRYRMFFRVASEVANACKDDRLKSATRPYFGGKMKIRDWQFWNMERAYTRFDTCRVDPSYRQMLVTAGPVRRRRLRADGPI